MIKTVDLFDLSRTFAADYLGGFLYPWEALDGIGKFLLSAFSSLGAEFSHYGENIYVHNSAKIASSAHICGPTVICAGAEIRHCAFIRGCALIGEECVVGNSCEVKNSILFDGVQTPHFNYVGDSILGFKAHLGAGAITSNVRSDKSNVIIHGEKDIPTGRKKVGAMLGDGVEIGCNSVLNPGTVIGKNSTVYPLSSVRGVIPADSIFKGGAVYPKK